MAILTFSLQHGYKVGESTHHEVGLRELSAKDIYEAQLASEHVTLIDRRPYAYTSNVEMGMNLLLRQIEFIGSIQGPFQLKELLKLHPDDFNLIQQQANELDKSMLPEELLEDISERGEP
jgi:phage FluMu protein gp41